MTDRTDRRGVMLAVAASAILSLNGLIFRSIEDASVWQVVFYRQAGLLLTMSMLFVARHRKRVISEHRRIWPRAVLPGVFLAGGTILFIVSLDLTTVANTTFMMSSAPLIAALFGWFVLGERVDCRTRVAIAAAMAGIAVMVAGGVRAGTLIGNLTALGASGCFAGFVVTLRRARHVDMTASICVAAVLSLIISGTVIRDFSISMHDAILCLTWGAVINCTGQICFLKASQRLLAAELTLIALAEFVLAPIWVWIAVGEVPGAATLVGGSIVLSAIGGSALGNLLEARSGEKAASTSVKH